jgi:hypothetical protein
MTVIKFPKSFDAKPVRRTIFICTPSYDDVVDAKRKFGLGYSREEAEARFFEGGSNLALETRTFTVATAPKWLKYQIVSQLLLFLAMDQPLSSIDEDALARLGTDSHKYGAGPRKRRS